MSQQFYQLSGNYQTLVKQYLSDSPQNILIRDSSKQLSDIPNKLENAMISTIRSCH